MQQHHKLLTIVGSFGLLFRPLSDQASFRIEEKPCNHPNVKMGTDFLPFN